MSRAPSSHAWYHEAPEAHDGMHADERSWEEAPSRLVRGNGNACDYSDLTLCGYVCCITSFPYGFIAPCFPCLRRLYVNGRPAPRWSDPCA